MPVTSITKWNNRATIGEGDITSFSVNTTGYAQGYSLFYRISGSVNSADIVGGAMEGRVVVNSQGIASINIELAKDLITEGEEQLIVTVEGVQSSYRVSDTSYEPGPASYTIVNWNGRTVAAEGESAAFNVYTKNVPAGTKIPYTITGVSAADIVGGALSGTVEVTYPNDHGIADGSLVGSINIPLAADLLTEGPELLSINVMGSVTSMSISDLSVSPSPTYRLSGNSASVDEGRNAAFSLSSVGATPGTVVNYVLSGVSGADIVGGSLTGSVSVGTDGTAVISVPLASDLTTEGNETLIVTVQGVSASTTINDTSNTLPSYALTTGAASVNEGASASFTLSTKNVAAGSTLTYTLSGISATDVASGSLTGTTITGTNGSSTIFIPITADKLTEGSETLTIAVQNASASTVINDTSKTITPTVSLSSNSASVNEGGTASFLLTTTNVPGGTLLEYTLSGVSSSDITGGALSGTVVVGTNANGTATIAIPVAADKTSDGSKILTVTVQGVSASTVLNDTSQGGLPTYTLSSRSTSVNEGSTAYFTLGTTNVPAGTSLAYTLSGVPEGGFINAADIAGGALSGTATVGSDGNATIAVPIAADLTQEGNEILMLTSQGKTVSLNINDTSIPLVPTYRLTPQTSAVNEGSTAYFTLATTNVPAGTSVAYTLSGVPEGGFINTADILGGSLSGVATVGSDGTATIAVPIAADLTQEGNEILMMTAQGTSTSVNINDTSIPLVPTYRLTPQTVAVNEGTTAYFALSTTNVAAGATLFYSLSGIDAPDVSNGSLDGSVIVNANGRAVIAVPIAADKLTEQQERLTVTVENASASLLVTDSSRAVATYELRSISPSVFEGGTASFALNTTNLPAGAVVTYSVSGVQAEDIPGGQIAGAVSLDANGAASITVPLAADSKTEGNEILLVTVEDKTASTVVQDSSKDPVESYTITPSNASVDEGNIASFTVQASNIKMGTQATYRLTGLDATDITNGQVNGRVTFDDLGMATIFVPIAADNKTEGSESLTVAIGSAVSTIAVNDSSRSASQYYITSSEGLVEEGKVATFIISAADAVAGTRLQYQLSGNGITAKDIANGKLSGSVAVGVDSSALVTIPITADKTTEGEENLTLTIVGKDVSETITIDDTSAAAVAAPTYTLTAADSSLTEGEIAEFTLETTGVEAGTKLKYLISGVSAADLFDKRLTGTVEVGEDGSAIISIATAVDALTEGNETLSVTVNGQKASMALLDDNSIKVAESLLEAGDVSLYKTSKGAYALAAPGLEAGDGLEDYIPLKTNPTKDYTLPKGLAAVLSYADGSYGLISATGSGAKTVYSEQKFSEDGIAKGKSAKLTAAQVLSKETVGQTDINGDGVIGEVIDLVLDGDGDANQQDFGLYKLSSGTIVLGEAALLEGDSLGSSVVLMASKTKGWTIPAGSTVVGMAITDGGSLEVLTLKGRQYSAQKFDTETGLIKGKATTLKTAQVDAREFYYDLDLTDDGEVSLVGQSNTPVGWTV